MRKIAISLAILAACVSHAGGLRTQITVVNKKLCAALVKGDIDAFNKIVKAGITSDFKYVENGQTQTFEQMSQTMREGMKTMKLSSATSTIKSFKESGTSATCVTVHSMAGKMMGPDKKSHKITFSGTSTDVYRKEKGGWKMASMSWGPQKMTMDGKPFDPMKASGG